MYLKRSIYNQLLDWKKDSFHRILEVNGARQAGKTYIINKFADENFKHKIYINLFDLFFPSAITTLRFHIVIFHKTQIRILSFYFIDRFLVTHP